jgi:hypothetical protein
MVAVNAESGDAPEAVATQEQFKRERLRLTRVDATHTMTGNCAVEVELEWLAGERVVGRSHGQASTAGDLRIAALAAIDALEKFATGDLKFELTGIKGLRAFDANIVIVSIAVRQGPGPQRLLGSCLAETDTTRASVIAVLNATNRVLGNYITTR